MICRGVPELMFRGFRHLQLFNDFSLGFRMQKQRTSSGAPNFILLGVMSMSMIVTIVRSDFNLEETEVFPQYQGPDVDYLDGNVNLRLLEVSTNNNLSPSIRNCLHPIRGNHFIPLFTFTQCHFHFQIRSKNEILSPTPRNSLKGKTAKRGSNISRR